MQNIIKTNIKKKKSKRSNYNIENFKFNKKSKNNKKNKNNDNNDFKKKTLIIKNYNYIDELKKIYYLCEK